MPLEYAMAMRGRITGTSSSEGTNIWAGQLADSSVPDVPKASELQDSSGFFRHKLASTYPFSWYKNAMLA